MKGKTALVTGAATGIGAAVSRALAAAGVQVAVCDINETQGRVLAEDIGGIFVPCDVTNFDSVRAAVDSCVEQLGVPDYVHLNAGIMTVPTGDPYLAIEEVSQAQYRKIVGVNLDGVFHGVKALLPLMRSKGGTITITASTAGLTVVPVDPMYTATKYALVGFGRAVAAANAGSSVRINVICPGVVDTAIVPDDFRKPEYGMMPAAVMAAEVVDLLVNGANGEVRVKNAADRSGFAVSPPDLNQSPVLPTLPEGLTPAWLTGLFRSSAAISDDTVVTAVAIEQVGDGSGMMSELARLRLTFDGADHALPATLIAKFPSRNPTNREVAMSYRLYEREVRYFAELEHRTSAHSPATVVSERQGDNFLILMEDMAGYQVGDQAVGATLAQTQLMLAELAKLHGAFWNAVDDLEWVPGIADSYHATNMRTLIEIGWPNMVELFHASIDPQITALGERFITALPTLQARMHAAPRTLLHGDFRMENVFFGVAPEHQSVSIIDWQGPLIGKGMVDVALMLAQSTQTQVRRDHERALIAQYAEQLRDQGVTHYDPEQAWTDYEQAVLYNWVYVGVVAGTLDASNERAFQWMSKMVARQSAASLDLNVFRWLPE